MAYRNEIDAVQAHCDSLRRQLKEAELGSEELQKANRELEATLAKLGVLRISEAERQIATVDVSKRAKLVGAPIAMGVVVTVLGGVNFCVWQSKKDPTPAKPIVVDRRGLALQTPLGTRVLPTSPNETRPALSKGELAELDRDIEALMAEDPSPKAVREIWRIMEAPERGELDRALLNMTMLRPKSAVPMLLKRAGKGGRQNSTDTGSMGFAFTSLTGQAVDRTWGINHRNAGRLYREWWKGSKDTFTTDVCKMSEEDRLAVVRVIALRASGKRTWGSAALAKQRAPKGDVYGASLCPGMAEDLLYVVDEKIMRSGATAMLATLYRRGDAPQLKDVPTSENSTPAARLTALLALADAGEPFDQKLLLKMFKNASDPGLIEAMIYAMSRCDASVVPHLREELGGPYHRAAESSLRSFE